MTCFPLYYSLGTFANQEQDILRGRLQEQGLSTDRTIIVPVVLYSDGVAFGFNNSGHVVNSAMSAGVFSGPMMRKQNAKEHVGFAPDWANLGVSKEALTTHLLRVFGDQKGKVEDELKIFEGNLIYSWWAEHLEHLRYASKVGFDAVVLGRGIYHVFTPLYANAGDIPEQQLKCNLKGATSAHACSTCEFPTGISKLYSTNI
jgi:hypothetical protein